MSLVHALVAELDDRALDQLVELIAPRLAQRALAEASPWMNVEEAADYVRAGKQRIYDLVHNGKLQPARDGKRLLFHRDVLDAYLEAER